MRSRLGVLVVSMAIATGAGAQTVATWARPDMFWYRRDVAGGSTWVQVDARTGAHELLFDHTRLASDLTAKLDAKFTALTLPFADPAAHFTVKFDGSNAAMQTGAMALEFAFGGELWRCDMQAEWDWYRASDYECASRGAFDRFEAPLRDSEPRVSPDGKWEALIVDHNVVVRAVGSAMTTVLSKDGSASFAYHAGSIVWAANSKSLAAYRVNSVVFTLPVRSSAKSLVVRGEWSVR